MAAHWQMFAGYNAWANQCIYKKAAELGDEDYRADRGAFFKSVHGTLNHLLVADRTPGLDLVTYQRLNGLGRTRRLD